MDGESFCITSAAIRSFAGAKRRQNLSRTGAEQDSILLPPLAPREESRANEEEKGPRSPQDDEADEPLLVAVPESYSNMI